MKYLGGKHGIGKHIAEFMTEQCDPSSGIEGYLEPFCGSLGVFKHMTKYDYKKFVASDYHPDLIAMWQQLQKNQLRIPKEMTETQYNKLKNAASPNAMKAVAGFGLSFGGKFFAGFAQKWAGNSGRDFLREFRTSIEKIKPAIQKDNVTFVKKSYDGHIPKNMLVYCDPPYRETEGYSTGSFDHDAFWETMRQWSRDNCVFVSEENAPKDFRVVWRRKKRRTLDKGDRFYKEEKLYMYKGGKFGVKKTGVKRNEVKKTGAKKTGANEAKKRGQPVKKTRKRQSGGRGAKTRRR